jgi:hypothetical protein
VAAGGIADGRTVAAALALSASADLAPVFCRWVGGWAVVRDLVLASARLRQRFLPAKRIACGDCALNDIAHFTRWSNQQAKLADDQMCLFKVGCGWRLWHAAIVP